MLLEVGDEFAEGWDGESVVEMGVDEAAPVREQRAGDGRADESEPATGDGELLLPRAEGEALRVRAARLELGKHHRDDLRRQLRHHPGAQACGGVGGTGWMPVVKAWLAQGRVVPKAIRVESAEASLTSDTAL